MTDLKALILAFIFLFFMVTCAHAETINGHVECNVIEIVTQIKDGTTHGLENMFYVIMPDGSIAF